MHPDVKHFIEYNIELVDNNDWEQFFESLYKYNTSSKGIFYKRIVDVLQDAGIDILTLSYQARKNVIYKIMNDIVEDLLNRNSAHDRNWVLPTAVVFPYLKCGLGLEQEDLIEIFKAIGYNHNLEYNSSDYYLEVPAV